MQDNEILDRIDKLVTAERELRNRGEGHPLGDEELQTLRRLEVTLDQLWDLLDQRRYAREAGLNPEGATLRDPRTVESYLQ